MSVAVNSQIYVRLEIGVADARLCMGAFGPRLQVLLGMVWRVGLTSRK